MLTNTNNRLEPFEFLGTMAGDQTHLEGNNKDFTYGRVYKPFGGSDDLRKKISMIGSNHDGFGYKKIGDEYSYTPFTKGKPFSHKKPSSLPGGGFFLTVKTFDEEDQRRLNCFAYALGTFGDKLELIADKDMKDIQKSVSQSIDDAVEKYFSNVSVPEDGDLTVYNVSKGNYIQTGNGSLVSGTTHAGVYRKSEQNWHSPPGGTIESKWGYFGNPYVFQHDVFFTPDFYGDQVKFYKIKKLD